MSRGGPYQDGSLKETNNQAGGKSGSGTPRKPGPVKSVATNPLKGGGINRSTNK